jgi:hypothetical protein
MRINSRRSLMGFGALAIASAGIISVTGLAGPGSAQAADTARTAGAIRSIAAESSSCDLTVVLESLTNLSFGLPSMVPWCGGPGTTDTTVGQIDPISQVLPVTDNRIWFHQNSDGSGWSYCISGADVVTDVPSADQSPGNVQVSDNTSPC